MPSKSIYPITKKIEITPHGDGGGQCGQWAVWVNHDEEGLGDTSDIPAFGDIDADNDAVISPRYRASIDISHGLSYALGKQLPMTAIYRIKAIQVGIRPVDDVVDMADGHTIFAGQLRYIFPNKHNIDAIQAARDVERMKESVQVDSDADIFGTQNVGYNGFRFGYRTESDVKNATREDFGQVGNAVEGGTASWTLYSDDGALGILDNYNTWKGLVPQVGQETRNLWDKRVGHPSYLPWQCSWNSHSTGGSSAFGGNLDFRWQASSDNHLPVLGGLMMLDVIYSSADPPGTTDDDFNVFITVEVEGWEVF